MNNEDVKDTMFVIMDKETGNVHGTLGYGEVEEDDQKA
ncbi:hypothetical protein 031MP004_85 [Bacillus phage 031MP004]|nr:hypothetical protein 022DV001_84 [Bacillus phage 022DV001]QFG05486.1 hypothetical protein 031MP003_87 [Bacillus phage 031MP003]QFG05662.1 hypothetical protein 031MP004_85 [Bacillus phage 031MP004]QFG05834.1 hypothetical protein 055SW001_84 [Bacillus phage 055SW001]